MKKGLKIGLIGFIVILVAGIWILSTSVDSMVKSGLEKTGSEMTGTRVMVDHVSISPFSGEGTVSGFRVTNPEGYGTEHAIEIDDFYISLELFSLFSDEIRVREIRITGPSLYVEQQLPANNLRTILNNIRESAEERPAGTDMRIGRFLILDGSVDLYTEIGGERSARVEMSEIELHDIGTGDTEAAMEQVIVIIAEEITQQALQAAARSGAEQLRDAIRDVFN
jgi:hypothetical protein